MVGMKPPGVIAQITEFFGMSGIKFFKWFRLIGITEITNEAPSLLLMVLKSGLSKWGIVWRMNFYPIKKGVGEISQLLFLFI